MQAHEHRNSEAIHDHHTFAIYADKRMLAQVQWGHREMVMASYGEEGWNFGSVNLKLMRAISLPMDNMDYKWPTKKQNSSITYVSMSEDEKPDQHLTLKTLTPKDWRSETYRPCQENQCYDHRTESTEMTNLPFVGTVDEVLEEVREYIDQGLFVVCTYYLQ